MNITGFIPLCQSCCTFLCIKGARIPTLFNIYACEHPDIEAESWHMDIIVIVLFQIQFAGVQSKRNKTHVQILTAQDIYIYDCNVSPFLVVLQQTVSYYTGNTCSIAHMHYLLTYIAHLLAGT